MNNDNDLDLHSMTKLSGWLRYWIGASTETYGQRRTDTILSVRGFSSTDFILLTVRANSVDKFTDDFRIGFPTSSDINSILPTRFAKV